MSNKKDFLKKVTCIDFETTDRDFRIAEVIECGVAMRFPDDWKDIASLYKPSDHITPEISAITNITDDMVMGSSPFEDDVERLIEGLSEGADYFVAHNSFYDERVLQRYTDISKPWICTMRMAKKLFANDQSVTQFNLPYLRYRFKLPINHEGIPHRAGYDAYVTGHLLEYLITEAEKREVIDISQPYGEQVETWLSEPIIYNIMPMGKHIGKPMVDVPMDYWKWALNNMKQLDESKDEYDADLAASVAVAIEEIMQN